MATNQEASIAIILDRSFAEAEDLLRHFISNRNTLDGIQAAASTISSAFRMGRKVLTCGNGGSMCDAMHFAEEWSGRFRSDRRPYPALALSDPAHMSCVANDYGFENVFSRQVEALAQPGDVLILLSTSGNSPNIIAAARAGRQAEASVIGFLGKGGGDARELCDTVIHAPGENSDRIQELHMLALHIISEAVEQQLGYS